MDERVIHLEDGTTVEAKVNFATLYYMQKEGVVALLEKMDKKKGKKHKYEDDDSMELLARMLYVILLSNGRKCSFEDALVLMPLDDVEFEEVLEDFAKKMQDFKKKQDAKRQMKNFTSSLT